MTLRILLALFMVLPTGCASIIRERIYDAPRAPVSLTIWPNAPEMLAVPTADGLALQGFHWPGDPADRDIVIWFHGRRNDQGRGASDAHALTGRGNAVLVASYRGFAGNPGKPTEPGLTLDARAFIAEARRLKGPDARIFLVGHSLGGAVALAGAAAEPGISGIILLSTFADLREMTPRLGRALLPDRWDNLSAVGRLRMPVLILHGTADGVVPYAQARQLLEAAPEARLVTMPGAMHRPRMDRIGPVITAAIDGGLPASLPQGWTIERGKGQ